MARPRLLDLFCGGGGATRGYQLAGFHVTGVDIAQQPHYCGDTFIQADALTFPLEGFDVIHASPPCQAYSSLKGLTRRVHPQLIEATRQRLVSSGLPYVLENVVGADLRVGLLLCGSMFGLQTSSGVQLRRHRVFESPILLMSPGQCQHGPTTIAINGHEFGNEASRWAERRTITVTGSTPQRNIVRNRIRETFTVREAQQAMGIDWMPMKALSQAIPTAYTQWIGCQLMAHVEEQR